MIRKLVVALATFTATSALYAGSTLTFYCGSTMSGAIGEISKQFGAKNSSLSYISLQFIFNYFP